MMIPFLESDGGNCQNDVILVEELAFMVKLPGDPEGTAIRKRKKVSAYMRSIDKRPKYERNIAHITFLVFSR